MPRTVSIGCQDFETIRREGYFYIDKSCFIKEWWEEGGQRDLDYPPQEVREDTDHEHGRKVLFCGTCR